MNIHNIKVFTAKPENNKHTRMILNSAVTSYTLAIDQLSLSIKFAGIATIVYCSYQSVYYQN